MELSCQLHDQVTLPHPPVKEPQYPLDRRLGWRSERSGEEKNSQPLPGIEPRSSGP